MSKTRHRDSGRAASLRLQAAIAARAETKPALPPPGSRAGVPADLIWPADRIGPPRTQKERLDNEATALAAKALGVSRSGLYGYRHERHRIGAIMLPIFTSARMCHGYRLFDTIP